MTWKNAHWNGYLAPGPYVSGGLAVQGYPRQAGKSNLVQMVSVRQALAASGSFISGQPGFLLCYQDGSVSPVPPPETGDGEDTYGNTIKSGTITAIQVAAGTILTSAGPVKVRLYTGTPPALPPGKTVPGAGYTSGGKAVASKQPPDPGKPEPAQGAQGLFQVVPSKPRPGASWYNRGIDGFDGYQVQPADGFEVPDVFGTVRGYRWWSMPAPPLHESPARAGELWPARMLQGMRDVWLAGENTAKCLVGNTHDPSLIPELSCGCGYWAYWRLQVHDIGSGSLPVCGVVEGYGAVLIGEKGFRAAKARIVALHLPFKIMPADYLPASPEHGHGPGWSPVQSSPVPELDPASAEQRAEGVQARADAAEAWMAVIGDRLAQLYPDAQVFETRQALEAAYPPDLSYVPDQQVQCPYCLAMYVNRTHHDLTCPKSRIG